MIKNVFDWVKEIAESKKPWETFSEEEHNVWNTYVVLKCFSMDPDYIEISNLLHSYWNMEPERVYKCLCSLIPKGKYWFKYIKSKTPKPNPELLEYISTYFRLSKREVVDYVPIIDKKYLEQILQQLNVDETDIKKLIKEKS